jgi:hypothetical protein
MAAGRELHELQNVRRNGVEGHACLTKGRLPRKEENMGPGARKKVTVLIPLTFNDGSTVPQESLLSIFERLFLLCGGYTNAGTVGGVYGMAGGKKQVDECLQLWVVATRTEIDELRRLVRQFGQELGQESMYFEVGGEVEFLVC